MAKQLKTPVKKFVMLASGARSSSATSVCFLPGGDFTNMAVALQVTQASGTSPTLNVYLQQSFDKGTTYYDVVSFTQATASNANIYWANLCTGSDMRALTGLTTSALTAANVSASVISRYLRVVSTIAGTTPQFTYSLTGYYN